MHIMFKGIPGMAVITKFNAMIRNRWLWSFFLIKVSVSFIGAFSKMEGCAEDDRRKAGEQ